MKKIISNILLVLILLLGLGLICYPTVSNWYNEQVGSYYIKTYQEVVDSTPYELYESIFDAARSYNDTLNAQDPTFVSGVAEDESYIDSLNINNGMMGALVIEKINVSLPIYHGTDEGVLQTSIGHLEGSALPTGTEGEHTVLTGHTGLPSATLLTNLTQLEIGDTFEVHVLNQIYTYEVFELLVVEPHEVDALTPVAGKNLVTLVTCTPYGINSHRLFVQGELISTQTVDSTPTQDTDTTDTPTETQSDIPAWAEDFAMICATSTAQVLHTINNHINTLTHVLQDIDIAPYWLLIALFALLSCLMIILSLRRQRNRQGRVAPKHYQGNHGTEAAPQSKPKRPKHYNK
ncbi:MAG: class C sortase [Faecalibacterium sp.]